MIAPRATALITRKTLWFGAYVVACLGISWPSLRELLQLALSKDAYSHILLIPFITIGLVLMRRHGWTPQVANSPRAASVLFLAGALIFSLNWRYGALMPGGDPLALSMLVLVLLIWSGFLFFYGTRAFHSVQFPLLFLLLAAPLPQFLLDGFIEWLRVGSAEVTYGLFRLTGTPVFRQGFIFFLPGVSIDIAPECSGIRSAVALLITCLLAGYLFLRSKWARIFLLLAAIPVLVIKNGIRIVTLTLLAIHVDPGFLAGNLHHQGGFVFFLIGLLILWPVLLWLQSAETKFSSRGGKPTAPVPSGSRMSSTAMPGNP